MALVSNSKHVKLGSFAILLLYFGQKIRHNYLKITDRSLPTHIAYLDLFLLEIKTFIFTSRDLRIVKKSLSDRIFYKS